MKRTMAALTMAVVLAGTAPAVTPKPKPDAPVSYCEYAWWVVECWFVPVADAASDVGEI